MSTPTIFDKIRALLVRVQDLLQGEPVRFIIYGAAIVVVGVVYVANALGISRFGGNLSLTAAIEDATAAITLLVIVTEKARSYVTPAA